MCHQRPSTRSLHLTRWKKRWHIDPASACPCLSPSLPPLPPPDAYARLAGSVLSILWEISRSKSWSCKLVTSCLRARSSEVLTRLFSFLRKLGCSPSVSCRVELQVRGDPSSEICHVKAARCELMLINGALLRGGFDPWNDMNECLLHTDALLSLDCHLYWLKLSHWMESWLVSALNDGFSPKLFAALTNIDHSFDKIL